MVFPQILSSQEVIISEFLASNVTGRTDEDGDESDWIELSNQSGSAVDLGGWSLTDEADDLRQWIFPSVTLAAGGKLLVFASGKDRAVAGSELHTNFRLRAAGEYLALVGPDGISVATELARISHTRIAESNGRAFSTGRS